jgi:RNA polymerase sigma factor (sigma-70 family)
MERSDLVNRLPFGRFDKEPDVSLRAFVPTKRTLYCLAGHGVTTLEQLQQLRLGTLLSMHHYFPGDDIPNLMGRLKEHQSSECPSSSSNNPDRQSIPQFDLDDVTGQLPIDVLDLSLRTRQHLLWEEVGDSLQSYLGVKAHHPPPTNNPPLQTVTKQEVTQQWTTLPLIEQQERPQTAPSQGHANNQAVKKDACELADLPDDFEGLASAALIPMQTGNVDKRDDLRLRGDRKATRIPMQTGKVKGVDALPREFENRPIAELGLPTYSLDCLTRIGFETIGELWAILTQGYSRFPTPEVGGLLWDEIWEVTTRYVTSRIVDSTPLNARFDTWFAQLNERQRQVLEWRYGLTDGQCRTLEETGRRLDLTRERVRQIEHKALQLLQHPTGQGPVHALIAELHAAVVAEGGVMSEGQLGNALADIAEIGDTNPQGAVWLLLNTSEKLSKVKGMQAWCLPQLCDLVSLIGPQVINILTQALAPLSADDLVQRCKQIQGRDDQPNELYGKFILACVHVNERLVERDDGSIGLAIWERHWQDDIVLALRRLGQPAHYTAIADAINASLQDGQQVTARAVHIRLMQHPEIFVWIGRKGTYGLREWGLERAISYVDALTQVLQDAGHPLTMTEILAALDKLRPYHDEASVQLTLGTNSQFRTLPRHTFGLAEWREEDFASGDYRVQRLFENS